MTSDSKMAVAAAALHHLLEVTKCKTLFITHYPLVATELEKKFPSDVQNLHVGYTAETRIDGKREIAFLYRLAPGAAAESFGIECARLAGIPEAILEGAREQSTAMSIQVEQRLRKKRSIKF
jgi:DNA mismatch repair protein MSH3